ncbi:hypothetical protein [Arenimonas caeni]|jgi:hypothetical protein|uniref:Uncharacterized protein n=1 Tax=Arenimonas caeni TaxID=2058085 RepID=A0A2P6M8Q7_9GAMM|nr:hypothetical protein [Arenimonas caeni]MDY0022883.1 hypothetical protein [Arenimonas caeni]PRH82373.1 hypothetical protein C6N40_07595 [Arenimonas caeni]
MAVRYLLRLPVPEKARGTEPALAFRSDGAEGFAEELQAALRGRGLFERWRAMQDDPEDIDEGMGEVDPDAVVTGRQEDLHIALEATTSLPGAVFRHRLRLLAGSNWELADVRPA